LTLALRYQKLSDAKLTKDALLPDSHSRDQVNGAPLPAPIAAVPPRQTVTVESNRFARRLCVLRRLGQASEQVPMNAGRCVCLAAVASMLVCLFCGGECLAAAIKDEIPLEAILGNKRQFELWSAGFREKLAAMVNATPGLTPASSSTLNTDLVDGIRITTVAFEYPAASILHGKPGGGVLAVPAVIDPKRPLIIAVHGHEHSPWGNYPVTLFTERSWPYEVAKHGYVVWAPVSMYHEEISAAAATDGYIPVWTQIVSEGLDYAASSVFSKFPHSGYAILGLSSGGHIAFTLMALRPDIKAGVFAGADQDLQFLRSEYRIRNHPNCWDIPSIASYTSIQALIAPRPVQFQIGRRDPFYPDGKPFAPDGASFSGTTRDVLSDESAGHILILRSIWRLMGAPEVSYDVHPGGHEMDTRAALQFLSASREPR
jgi:dienelactone hydrolase